MVVLKLSLKFFLQSNAFDLNCGYFSAFLNPLLYPTRIEKKTLRVLLLPEFSFFCSPLFFIVTRMKSNDHFTNKFQFAPSVDFDTRFRNGNSSSSISNAINWLKCLVYECKKFYCRSTRHIRQCSRSSKQWWLNFNGQKYNIYYSLKYFDGFLRRQCLSFKNCLWHWIFWASFNSNSLLWFQAVTL